jgi:flagellar biosynthesis component FlhA
MLPKIVNNMLGRMTKTAEDTSKMLVKSLGQTPVQIVLGMILVVYIAFLESEKESMLSVLMNNPIGRLLVMGFLAILAVAAPPVAILFAVLVVMSYARSDAEMVMHQEGFWAEEKHESKKEDENKDAEKEKSEDHSDLMKQLSTAMKTITASDNKEGFGPMYEGVSNLDDENVATDEDVKAFENSMNNIGGLVGYSADVPSHSSP